MSTKFSHSAVQIDINQSVRHWCRPNRMGL